MVIDEEVTVSLVSWYFISSPHIIELTEGRQ